MPQRFHAPFPDPGRYPASRSGFTIVELVVAAALLAIAMGGLFQLSVHSLRLLKTQSESASAAGAIQEHVDFLRDQTWGTLTSSFNYTDYTYNMFDPATGQSTPTQWVGILKTLPSSATSLKSATEKITISAYGASGTPPAPIVLTITSGTMTVSPTEGTNLSTQKMVKVDIRLSWNQALSNRPRAQEASFIIAKNGVGK